MKVETLILAFNVEEESSEFSLPREAVTGTVGSKDYAIAVGEWDDDSLCLLCFSAAELLPVIKLWVVEAAKEPGSWVKIHEASFSSITGVSDAVKIHSFTVVCSNLLIFTMGGVRSMDITWTIKCSCIQAAMDCVGTQSCFLLETIFAL